MDGIGCIPCIYRGGYRLGRSNTSYHNLLEIETRKHCNRECILISLPSVLRILYHHTGVEVERRKGGGTVRAASFTTRHANSKTYTRHQMTNDKEEVNSFVARREKPKLSAGRRRWGDGEMCGCVFRVGSW
jgi:hypothetical protein